MLITTFQLRARLLQIFLSFEKTNSWFLKSKQVKCQTAFLSRKNMQYVNKSSANDFITLICNIEINKI